MEWLVELYRDKNGREPVAEFLDSLPEKARAKAVRLLSLLTQYGVLLKEPYTKQIKGKIRELRISEHTGEVRVLYFTFTDKKFILLHGFIKKTGKTPVKEIDVAVKRMNDFIERSGGKDEK